MQRVVQITIGTLLVVSLFLILFGNLLPFAILESITQKLFSRPKAALYYYSQIEQRADEKALTSQLVAENRKLVEELAALGGMKKDNEALRSQFEDTPIATQNLLQAKVIGYNGKINSPHILVIDAGDEQGVKKNMSVVFQKNLVGKIDTVSTRYSTVLLPNSKNFTALAKTAEGDVSGIIKGQEDFILLERVVITDTLDKEDIIVTKGEVGPDGIGIMPDLIIGKITSINKVESQPFQSGVIKSLLDYSALGRVFVVKQL